MDKKSIIFAIVFAFVFTAFVVFKSLNSSEPVELDKEFSLAIGQVVSVKNDDLTKIKLDKINDKCPVSKKCEQDFLSYDLVINGKDYSVTEVPYSIDLRNNYIVNITDGDEDHLVVKVVKK